LGLEIVGVLNFVQKINFII